VQTSGADPAVPFEMADRGQSYGRGVIARNAFWRVFDSAGSELLSMLFFIALGRLLEPADFGVVAIATAFLLGCQVMLRSGFGIAIIQRHWLEGAHLDAAFWANLALGLILAAVLIAISAPVAAVLGKPTVMPVLAALAPTLVLGSAAWIFHARFRREMRYDIVAWSSLASIGGGGLAGLLLALSGAGLWSLVGQQVTGVLLGVVVLVACSPWRPGLAISAAHLRDLASFSAKIVAGNSLEAASQRAIPLILAFFVTAHAVGLYAIASRLVWALANVSMFVIFDLGLVVLSQLHGRPDRHREGAYYTLRMTTLFCLPLFVGFALIADPLIPFVLGAQWRESIPLFQLLCVFSILLALYRCAQQILISAGRPEAALQLSAISGVLVPVTTVATAPFGIVAATAAASFAMMITLPLAVRYLRAELGLSLRRVFAEQLPIWLAVGVMALSLWLLPLAVAAHQIALVVLQVLCGALVFLAGISLFAPAYAREIRGTLRAAFARRAPGS
jgi:O-antigen/teichoic acid export membrane protein